MGYSSNFQLSGGRGRLSRDILLFAEDDEILNDARVLRAFDRCRRDLGVLVSGREGVFVGFDTLEIFAVLTTAKIVRAEAVLLQDLGVRHSVEYRATVIRTTQYSPCHSQELLVAHASGWTLVPGRTPALDNPRLVPPIPHVLHERKLQAASRTSN